LQFLPSSGMHKQSKSKIQTMRKSSAHGPPSSTGATRIRTSATTGRRTGAKTMVKYKLSTQTYLTPSMPETTDLQTGRDRNTLISSLIMTRDLCPPSLRSELKLRPMLLSTLRSMQISKQTLVTPSISSGSNTRTPLLIRANVAHPGHSPQLPHLRSRTLSPTNRQASLNSQSSRFSIAIFSSTTAKKACLQRL
jgi:hypothetical protein